MRIILVWMVLILGGCAAVPDQAPKKDIPIPVFPPPPEKARFIYERSLYSSLDVEADDSTSAFRRFATGEQRHGEGFAKPFDVVAHRGRIYVGDTVRRSVMAFDVPGKRYFEIGRDEPGRLYMPLGMAKDGQGNLYVCDGTAKRVTVYNRDGKFLRAIGGKKYFKRPSGVAVDQQGKHLYVVDTGGVDTQEHRVRVFDAINGDHLFDIGTRGTDKGQFNLPRDAAIGPGGQVYVVDGGNFRVQVFEPDGKFVRSFGDIGRRSGQFSRPKGIATDKDDNVYVVDTAFGNIQLFSPDGQLLLFIGGRGATDGPAKYMLPAGIDIDADGRIYIVDQFFRKVDIYRPAGLAKDAGYLAGGGRPAKKAK